MKVKYRQILFDDSVLCLIFAENKPIIRILWQI